MPIESWFPTLIYFEDLNEIFNDDFNERIYLKAKELQKTHIMKTDWLCDTYNTIGFDVSEEKLFSNLIEFVSQRVKKYSKEYDIDEKYNIKFEDCWINISSPGDYQEYHTHGSTAVFSAVYYVKAPKNSGNIIFRPIQNWIENIASKKILSCYYEPRNSLLLIFRSDLPHMVQKNKSDKERVSIAFNFTIEVIK